jgi:hypothetical protein
MVAAVVVVVIVFSYVWTVRRGSCYRVPVSRTYEFQMACWFSWRYIVTFLKRESKIYVTFVNNQNTALFWQTEDKGLLFCNVPKADSSRTVVVMKVMSSSSSSLVSLSSLWVSANFCKERTQYSLIYMSYCIRVQTLRGTHLPGFVFCSVRESPSVFHVERRKFSCSKIN